MKIKTSELTGPALDWAVAKCEIPNDVRDNRPRFWLHPNNPKLVCRITYNHETNPKGYELCRYSTDWAQGGPLSEREKIITSFDRGYDFDQPWRCAVSINPYYLSEGPTPLVAAMRCFCASKLGEYVDVPEELLK